VFAAKKYFPAFFILKARKNTFLVSNVPAKIYLAAKAEITVFIALNAKKSSPKQHKRFLPKCLFLNYS
jgi:hypothetical protein